jgi:hypothetical protein
MPVPALCDIVGVTHDAILFPGNQVLYPRFNAESAFWAGVAFLCLGSPDGLNYVGVPPLDFCAAKASLKPLHIQGFLLGALLIFGSITARHA